MPIYEYRCEDCGTRFEKLVRRSPEPAKLECPSGGKSRLEQQFSTFAAHAAASKAAQSEAPPCANGGSCNPYTCGNNFN